MAVTDRKQLHDALCGGTKGFAQLIGSDESIWLEFKSEPYRLTQPSEKFELAKDVSGLANASGGTIVIGVRTKSNETRNSDKVVAVPQCSIEVLDCDQLAKVISHYVYPPIEGLTCRFHEGEPRRGVVAITVPPQPDNEKFFVVTHGLDHAGGLTSNQIGLFIRDGSTTQALKASYVHELLRRGRQERERSAADDSNESSPQRRHPTRLQRLGDDARALGVEGQPYVYVQSWQPEGFELHDIHDRRPGGFRAVFDDPPGQLRPEWGFNYDFGIATELLPGGGLRRQSPESASKSVMPDGLHTLILGPERLGHAMHDDLINQFALNESVVEFCRFTFEELVRKRNGRAVLVLGVQNGDRNGPRAFQRDQFNYARLPSATFESEPVDLDDPGRAAYRVLSALFREFGLPDAYIRFGKPAAGTLDIEEIRTQRTM